MADALSARLTASGAQVHRLAVSDNMDATVAALDQLWQQAPAPHLFLTHLRDEESLDRWDPATWDHIYQQRVLGTYFLCQRWLQLAVEAQLVNQCTMIAVTDLGGDFGFSGNVRSPESGAITGLVKSICLEFIIMRNFKKFLCKAIDAPRGEPPERLVDNICRELAAATIDYEIAFVEGRRYLQVAVAKEADVKRHTSIQPGGNWVITGGARGISAACATELARRFQLKLNLIGSSPLPHIDPAWREFSDEQIHDLKSIIMTQARESGQKPNVVWERVEKDMEIDRTLRRMAEAGIQATYHCCDVSDRQALAGVLDTIRQADGPIDGILHGAGVERPCRFEKKTREDVLATMGAKVQGGHHLLTLTRNDPLRHFLGFGSVAGRLGSNGQTDYGMASDMLCKLASWAHTQRPDCHAIGFHWHPWGEVGMAAKPETIAMLKRTDGPQLMPLREGLRHMLRELYADPSVSEVMISEASYHRKFYPEKVSTADRPPPADTPSESSATVAATDTRPAVAQRLVMRMVDAPLPTPTPQGPAARGNVYIVGENPDARALQAKLEAQGATVLLLNPSQGIEASIDLLEQAWATHPAHNLFLMTSRDQATVPHRDIHAVRARESAGVLLPYYLTQRWFQLLAQLPQDQPATIVAATSLGGDFGFAADPPAPEGGALCGLLKSLFVEDVRNDPRRLRVKVVDSPADEPPEEVAEAICRELAARLPDVEVAWSNGRRQVVQSVPQPAGRLPQADLPPNSNWIVTGGARGITAAAAWELGRRYRLRLHLIGVSPPPDPQAAWRNVDETQLKQIKRSVVGQAIAAGRSPEEDWDRVKKDREIQTTLDRLAQAGIQATYHSCDVADRQQLSKLLDQIRAADGPIDGIIHGAGFGRPGRFESRRRDQIEKTFAAKLAGTLALMELTQQDPLRWFVCFGSLSGRFGGNGLSDYAAANDLLAKLAGWYRHRRPQCATSCMHWQTWDRVGMAMRADALGITKNAFEMEFILPEEGVEHLGAELRAGLPQAEVLITDGYFEKYFYGQQGSPGATGDLSPSRPQDIASPARREPHPPPLIASLDRGEAGQRLARILFQPETDPFLSEHRLRDKPFLPGVVGLEALAEAAAAGTGQRVVALHEVEIETGMKFHGQPIAARVTVTPTAAGLACELTSEIRDRKGRVIDPARRHFRGLVELSDHPLPLDAPPPGEPPFGWFPHTYADNGLLYHGPPLRCLKEFFFQHDGGWGRIVAPTVAELAGPRSPTGWILPIAVLDACVVACGSYVFTQFERRLEVPHSFGHLHLGRSPQEGESCTIRLFYRGTQERHSQFDFTLFGQNGDVIVQAENYRKVLVAERAP